MRFSGFGHKHYIIVLQYSTIKQDYQETHLISHASSYEVKEVFEQASVVLSVQVCQWSLLSDGSIGIQFCDQWPAETTAGLIPPQLQRVECVLPTHEQSTIKDLPAFKSEFWDVQ